MGGCLVMPLMCHGSKVGVFDISIIDISTLFENIDIDIDIDKVTLENIDIDIDIDKDILENIDIDIDKGIPENIDINIDIDKDILGKKSIFFSRNESFFMLF